MNALKRLPKQAQSQVTLGKAPDHAGGSTSASLEGRVPGPATPLDRPEIFQAISGCGPRQPRLQ